jgi:hypothetical protein
MNISYEIFFNSVNYNYDFFSAIGNDKTRDVAITVNYVASKRAQTLG